MGGMRAETTAVRGGPGVTRVAFPRQPNTTAWGAAPQPPNKGRDRLHLRRRSADKSTANTQGARLESGEERLSDPETGVVPGVTRDRNMRSRSRCSMCPAIHINSRSWLRSSSTHEPSDPPLRVVSLRPS